MKTQQLKYKYLSKKAKDKVINDYLERVDIDQDDIEADGFKTPYDYVKEGFEKEEYNIYRFDRQGNETGILDEFSGRIEE